MRNLGFYTCCNDSMLPFLKSWVGAARRYNPSIPLAVIPFNDQFTATRTFCSERGIAILTDDLARWRAIGAALYGLAEYRPGVSAANYFSKLTAFSGPSELFVFSDVNTLVMFSLPDRLTPAHFRGCGFMSRAMPGRNYNGSATQALYKTLNPAYERGFNAGFFLSRRGYMSALEVEAAIASPGFSRDYFGSAPEQSLLSWMQAKHRKDCYAIARSANIRAARMIDQLRLDGDGNVVDLEGEKVEYIKWTGQKAPESRRNRDILGHFAELGPQLAPPV